MLVTMPAEGEGYVVRKASADGSVELIDPEATLKASSLEFDWSTGVGEAHDAIVEIAGLRLRANSVDIRPNEWLLRDVEAQTLSSDGISFHMRSMRVMPGESAVAYRKSLDVAREGVPRGPRRFPKRWVSRGPLSVVGERGRGIASG